MKSDPAGKEDLAFTRGHRWGILGGAPGLTLCSQQWKTTGPPAHDPVGLCLFPQPPKSEGFSPMSMSPTGKG